MKPILAALFVLASSVSSFAQDAAVTLKLEAQRMVAAMRAGDYEKLAAYTPPQVVAGMGGREAMVASVKQGIGGMKAQGITFQDIHVGEPGSMQTIGTETVALIPEKVTLKVPGGHMSSDTFLIAISGDGGKSWVFADSAGFNKDNAALLKKIFPELVDHLHLPENKVPVFTAD